MYRTPIVKGGPLPPTQPVTGELSARLPSATWLDPAPPDTKLAKFSASTTSATLAKLERAIYLPIQDIEKHLFGLGKYLCPFCMTLS